MVRAVHPNTGRYLGGEAPEGAHMDSVLRILACREGAEDPKTIVPALRVFPGAKRTHRLDQIGRTWTRQN